MERAREATFGTTALVSDFGGFAARPGPKTAKTSIKTAILLSWRRGGLRHNKAYHVRLVLYRQRLVFADSAESDLSRHETGECPLCERLADHKKYGGAGQG